MGTSGHERLAVDDLNSTDVAGQWGERAGHFERTACEKTTFESSKKTKRRSNNTHNLVSCKEEMARGNNCDTRNMYKKATRNLRDGRGNNCNTRHTYEKATRLRRRREKLEFKNYGPQLSGITPSLKNAQLLYGDEIPLRTHFPVEI